MSRLWLAATALLLAAPTHAQDITAAIDGIFDWVEPGMPGCAIAASRNGELVVNRAYGLADLERGAALTPASVFDIASIRKQFIAAAVLLLVEDGRMSLSDDVRQHLPELPDYGHRVTLDHLLTHTSGLRDWVPLRNWANGSYDAMTMILRQRGLNFAPGEEWSYSNSGYVLLQEIVERTSGVSFSEFARTRLFDPLGMNTTSYVHDLRYVIENRALAWEPDGDRWRLAVLLENERGGGGALFSTAADLVTWSDALAGHRLGRFVSEKLEEPARLSNGRKLDYGRGVGLDSNSAGRIVGHSGGAAGYRSILVGLPEQRISIAVLCNAGEASDARDDFAEHILDLLVSPTVTRPRDATPAPAAPIEGLNVNGRAGLYFSERTGEPLRLIAGNGRLALAGGRPLVAVSTDRFRNARPSLTFMSRDEFELTFVSPDRLELKSMEGAITLYRRARPWTPTGTELQAFAGRFESDELRAVLEITPGGNGLLARLNDSPDTVLELTPVERDTFVRGMLTVRFVRDDGGAVVALHFRNPVLRNIVFARS